MKKNLFYFMMLLVGFSIMVSCDDDDDPTVIDNPVYGMQINGTATGGKALAINTKQMVEPTSDFATKVERTGMYYGIYYLAVGEFSFKDVAVDSETTYGITDVEETTQTAEAGPDGFIYKRGTLVSGSTGTFSITSDGLYYIITDETSSNFWVMKINNFEISSTTDKATMVSASATGAVFELPETDLRGAYKVRINSGWKIIADDIPYGTDRPDDGIRPVISFGGSLSALTFDGSDIAFTPIPLHLTKFTFTWNPAKKGIASITGATTDAGEKVPTDYSDYLLGLIGNGVIVADTSFGWGNTSYQNKLPVKDGFIYTWTWDDISIADTTGGRTWKFRKDNAWVFTLGFNSVSMSGSAGPDFFAGSSDGNFGIATSKVYNMKLEVDATSDVWTLYVAEDGGYLFDIWSLIGGATPAGWNDNAMTPNADGTEWTWTGDLIAGEFKFRVNGSWAYQIGDNGSGGAEFSTNATAWSIAAGDVGNYTIVLNSVTPTMTKTKN